MRDLSVQASSGGSLNDDAKSSIQKEISQLKSELTRISDTTTFNGTKLLDGNYKGTFQVGANAGQTISVNIGKAMSAAGLGVSSVDVTAAGKYGIASGGTASGTVVTTTATSAASAAMNFYNASGTQLTGASADASDYGSLTGTISFGGKTFDLPSVTSSNGGGDNGPPTVATSAQALTALNTAAKAALGLSTDPFASAANGLTFGVREAVADYTGANGAALTSTSNGTTWANPTQLANATPTFDGASGASQAIKNIDAAIKTVSSQRADLGAIQNRFEHTINNLNTAIENTTASESRIRDTDMASEMTSFTRAQVLTQAGTSMLAQANQSTQSILKLLG